MTEKESLEELNVARAALSWMVSMKRFSVGDDSKDQKSPLTEIIEQEDFMAFESPRMDAIVEKVMVQIKLPVTEKEVRRAASTLHAMSIQEAQMLLKIQDKYCVNCGFCCRTSHPVDFRKEELKAVAKHLGTSYKKLKKKVHARPGRPGILFVPGKPCPFLEGRNHCTIYEFRPLVCRMYPMGKTLSSMIRGEQVMLTTPEDCPAVEGMMIDMVLGRIIGEKLWEGEHENER